MMKPTVRQKILNGYREDLIANATRAERLVLTELNKLNVRFVFQKVCIARGYSCIADFYFPRPAGLVVEIDGGYHSNPEQKKKDDHRTIYLTQERHFTVLRFTNEEVYLDTKLVVAKIIAELIKTPRYFTKHALKKK